MNELYVLGIDIIEETNNLMRLTDAACTEGMTESELMAYKMGVKNVMSVLAAVIEENDMPVVNISGLEIATEFTIEELQEYFYN